MKLIYGKSKWEMWDNPLREFLERVKKDGFGTDEIYLKSLSESPEDIVGMHREYNLSLVGQILTQGNSVDEHIKSFEEQFDFALKCAPVIINTHAGKDFFTFQENLKLFRRIIKLSNESGVPVFCETHRGRPLYSLIETLKFLDELPELKLTADFSHWMVVHESNLSDQEFQLDIAIQRCGYIHARVGYEEGPQITDPRADEWKNMVNRYLNIWKRIIEVNRASGKDQLFITPEFGPPSYMHTLPFSNKPVADAWEINTFMKSILEKKLG